MSGLTLELLARVDPFFTGVVGEDCDISDAALWSLKVTGDSELRTANVVLARIDKPTFTSVPDEVSADFETMYGYETSTGFTHCEIVDGRHYVYANLASVLVVRALHVVLPDVLEEEVLTTISVQPHPKRSSCVTFTCALPVSFDDPTTFGDNLAYKVADVATTEVVEDLEIGEPVARPRPISESYTRVGDASVATVACDGASRLQVVPNTEGSFDLVLHDAEIYKTHGSDEFSPAMAELITRMRDFGEILLVGDHLGGLGRALADRGAGCTILGNTYTADEDRGTPRMGSCRFKRGTLGLEASIGEQLELLTGSDDYAWIVIDHWDGVMPAETVTRRNLELARLLLLECARKGNPRIPDVFACLHSAPLATVCGSLLMLPCTHRNGAEVYAHISLGRDRANTVGRYSFGFFSVEPPGQICVDLCDDVKRHDLFKRWGRRSAVHQMRTYSFDEWYDLIAGLHFVRASRHSAGGGFFDRCVSASQNAVGLTCLLREGVGDVVSKAGMLDKLYEDDHIPECNPVFNRLIERVSTLSAVIAARYDELARYCSHTKGCAPAAYGSFMLNPGAVNLFGQQETSVSDGLLDDLRAYKRVLPVNQIPILASNSFYKALLRYVVCWRELMGYKLPTWQLQRLLWRLSYIGSRNDKIAYLYLLLHRLISGAGVPLMRLGFTPDPGLDFHLWRLGRLRDYYASLDPDSAIVRV